MDPGNLIVEFYSASPRILPMWDRFPPRMRRVISASLEESARCGRDAVNPEDLLAVISRDPESAGTFVLEYCGINAQKAIQHPEIPTDNSTLPPKRASRLEDSCLQLLQAATKNADRLSHSHVGTEHVIIALARSSNLEVSRRLLHQGLTPQHADAALQQWIKQRMPRRRMSMTGPIGRWKKLQPILRPLQKLAKVPRLAWAVYIRKSLGHPGFVTNPYPLYRWLWEHEPVRRDPLAPVWILTRYDDVQNMLRDPRFRKDPYAAERLPATVREQLCGQNAAARVDIDTVSMLFLDPPAHTRVRAAFARAFTPASISQLRIKIEEITNHQLDKINGHDHMDLIADLAYPLPVKVIAELLGFPATDYERIKKWSDDFVAALALNATSEQQITAGLSRMEIRAYFDQVVSKITQPGNSLLHQLLACETEPGALNREEIFSNSVLLLAAGHETTTNLIGNGMLALLKNPDQWNALVADPTLICSAIEEMLRFDCPVQWTSRVAGELIEINGQKIPPGEIVLGCVGAANRDPAKFTDPDRFDLRRSDNKHLSFGAGNHFCLGAALARMEAEIALRALATRYPNLNLAKQKLTWLKGLTFRGIQSLAVKLK